MHRIKYVLFIIITITAIIGCTAPVYNIEDAQFRVSNTIPQSKIRQAILLGCKNAGWQARSLPNKKILATYSFSNNTFSAIATVSAAVVIEQGLNSYSIHYFKSNNLKHALNRPDAQGNYDQNYFEKLINNKDGTKQPETINKLYNSWVHNLEKSINDELNILNLGHPYSSSTQLSQSNLLYGEGDIKSKCAYTPDLTLSGTAQIKCYKANLRAGASMKCPIVDTLSKEDKVFLLGKHGNWYYIQQENGVNGWIHNSLIKINLPSGDTTQKVTSREIRKTEKQKPLPPTPASKRISIAVIQFKTLNKEAQDISLADLITESFTTALVNSNSFKIIEREQLDKVVKEMEMTQTGFIESTNAVEIGKMLHADAIITGSVALLNDKIQLNARIIEIESAFVISADSATTHYSLNNINAVINTIVNNLSNKLMESKVK